MGKELELAVALIKSQVRSHILVFIILYALIFLFYFRKSNDPEVMMQPILGWLLIEQTISLIFFLCAVEWNGRREAYWAG